MTMIYKTGSETTPRIYELLKGNPTREFTYGEIATELGFDKTSKVLGAANGLKKKGIIVDGAEVVQDEKPYKTLKIANPVPEVTFEMTNGKVATELSELAIDICKTLQDGKPKTAADIGAVLDRQPIAITGSVRGLINRELVKKIETEVQMPGSEAMKKVVQYQITDSGLTKVKENL